MKKRSWKDYAFSMWKRWSQQKKEVLFEKGLRILMPIYSILIIT
jgi:hypothetical protein